MAIEIKADFRDFVAGADLTTARARKAATLAANLVAEDIRSHLVQTFRDDIHEPVRFTLSAFTLFKARSYDRAAAVALKSKQAEYLDPVLHGGERMDKVVPARAAKLNRHGNMPRNYLRRMVAQDKAFWVTQDDGTSVMFRRDRRHDTMTAMAFRVKRARWRQQVDLDGAVKEVAYNRRLVGRRVAQAWSSVDGSTKS